MSETAGQRENQMTVKLLDEMTKTIDGHVFVPGAKVNVEEIDCLIGWIVVEDLRSIPNRIAARRFRIGTRHAEIHANLLGSDDILVSLVVNVVVERVHDALELIEFQCVFFELDCEAMRIQCRHDHALVRLPETMIGPIVFVGVTMTDDVLLRNVGEVRRARIDGVLTEENLLGGTRTGFET